jgi:hypothetical protein
MSKIPLSHPLRASLSRRVCTGLKADIMLDASIHQLLAGKTSSYDATAPAVVITDAQTVSPTSLQPTLSRAMA